MQAQARLLPTSLRARLSLAFLALVALILFVGVASYRINSDIRDRVSDLRSSSVIDLTRVDLEHVGLEFEGYWNPGGSFIARDVEVLPSTTRPRLRGAIKSVDREGRSFTLFGREIQVTAKSESGDDGGAARFDALEPGKRVEVTCKVTDGRWEAIKLYLDDVKSSDKVKGTATAHEIDGKAPETIDLHGLLVVIEPRTSSGPESALGRIEKATQMILVLQECRTLASEIVAPSGAEPSAEADADEEEDGGAVPLSVRLGQKVESFARLIDEAQAESGDPTRPAPQDVQRHLLALQSELPALRARARTLIEAAGHEPPVLASVLGSERALDVFLQKKLVPLAYSILSQAEDDLGDQLRGVLERASGTTRVALVTSLVAVVVALALGFLVWRSIHRPIRALQEAAQRFGQGHLDARVDLDSHDEFSVLAGAFNRMAGELASTTVSMESLESVFDSMAAALIVFDPEGRIVNVNRAALDLVGRERHEVIGETFDLLCRFSVGDDARSGIVASGRAGSVGVEKVFVRKDGSEFPVSFSGAELRSASGPLHGYVCVAQDLSEQKDIQRRLRESLGEKELLLREVHHRVKNNMQVVSSLLAMQSTSGDPEVARKLEESQNRIRSIALIHEQLYKKSDLAHIEVRTYLDVLTNQLLQSFGKAGSVRLELECDEVELDIDQSMACGLIVNELMTNALKYAYPGERGGVIRVGLHAHGEERVLSVSDDGPGIPEEARASRKTLGMSLVSTLARQLRGRVEIDGANGTHVRVFFRQRTDEGEA